MDSTSLAIVLAGFGSLLILLSHRRQVQHRLWSAVAHGVAGALIFISGVLLFVIALNLDTYERWQTNQPVAQLSIEETGPKSYRVSLMRIPSGDLQVLNLNGDEWHVTAQQLNWDSWPRLLGLQTDVRLQQLQSSGYKTEPSETAANYALSRNPGIDVWKLHERHPQLARWLAVRLLSSESMPLVDGLRYHLYLTTDGLVARAINKRRDPATAMPAGAAASTIHNTPAAGVAPTVRHK